LKGLKGINFMMKNFVKTAIALSLLSPITSAFAVPIINWNTGAGNNGHWYETILSVGVNRTEAKAIADAKGGHLVTITSQDEQDFIRDNILVPNSKTELEAFGFWTGGYATNTDLIDLVGGGSAGWAWDNGETWAFDNGLGFSADGNGDGIDEVITGTILTNQELYPGSGIFGFKLELASELASFMRISSYEDSAGIIKGDWSDLRDSGTLPAMSIDFFKGDILSPLAIINRTGGFIIEYTSRPTEVPVPSTLAILALGLTGLATRRFKKQA
jgi:hypothetical protein